MTPSRATLANAATVALVAYWLLIFTLTHTPREPGPGPPINDKVAHVLGYAGLSLLLALTLHLRGHRRLWLLVPLICALYGIADELLQIPVGRHCSLDDYLADLAGTAVGTATALLATRFFPLNPEP